MKRLRPQRQEQCLVKINFFILVKSDDSVTTSEIILILFL